jgi:hypothetical protein
MGCLWAGRYTGKLKQRTEVRKPTAASGPPASGTEEIEDKISMVEIPELS